MIFFSLILFFLVPQPSGKMVWDENRSLTWSDFKSKPPAHSDFVASTSTGITFRYSYKAQGDEVSFDFVAEAFFNPKKSWFRPGEVSDYILKHEQTHFDISELHARILRMRLSTKKFSKNINTEAERIYLQVEEQRKTMQKKYDAETDHSRKEKKELWWRNHIEKKLKEYDEWK